LSEAGIFARGDISKKGLLIIIGIITIGLGLVLLS